MYVKKKKNTSPPKRSKRILIFVIALAITFIVGAFVVYFLFANKLEKTFSGSPIDAITSSQPLQEAEGRTNFLIFGTSYDDPNPSHSGGYLTDSLIVLSVNKATKTAHTISIPRDLWVDYDTSCSSGSSGKINATYICALGSHGESEKDKASMALVDKVSKVVGLPIQYYIEVNYTFIQSLADALGGIDVDVYSQDDRGIHDINVGLKLPAGVNHLDGKTALKLARARNAAGGYGLPRSNFDREINQQRILTAIFKKLSASGDLSDVNRSYKLIDALSQDVRTNIKTSEIRSAITLAKSVDVNKIVSIPLVDQMTTGTINGQSIVRPTSGLNNYMDIQGFISKKLQVGKTSE